MFKAGNVTPSPMPSKILKAMSHGAPPKVIVEPYHFTNIQIDDFTPGNYDGCY